MRTACVGGAISTAALPGGAAAWRAADHRADRREAQRLAEFQPSEPERFDPSDQRPVTLTPEGDSADWRGVFHHGELSEVLDGEGDCPAGGSWS